MAQKVIIDTDPGIDDAMAIFMALESPELEVLGLTTVFGNATLEDVTRNALGLLQVAGRSDIPVIAGAEKPVASAYRGAVDFVHGVGGLGGATLPEITSSPLQADLADWIYEQASASPGEIRWLALGPLTNVYHACKKHPELPALLKEVVIMGGNALVPGNATPAAEANILSDPEAADYVLGVDWPLTMVGLDVTHEVKMTGAQIDQMVAGAASTNQLLREAIGVYRSFFKRATGTDGIYVHDPSAVAYLINSAWFTTSRWPVRVETEGISRGKTWPATGKSDEVVPPEWRSRPPINVCTEVDGTAVVNCVMERIG